MDEPVQTPPAQPEQSAPVVPPQDSTPRVESISNTTISGEINPNLTNSNVKEQQKVEQAPIQSNMPAENLDNLNNEITNPKKLNYPLIAIIAGVLLLLITGAFYYFMIYSKNNTANVSEEMPAPIVDEMPVVDEAPVVIEDTSPIAEDPVIQNLNSIGTTEEIDEIEQDLNSIDFEGIDTNLQLSDF